MLTEVDTNPLSIKLSGSFRPNPTPLHNTDKKVAETFRGTLFEIHVPKGTRVLPVIMCATIHAEIEVMLPRNGVYTIVKQDDGALIVNYKQNIPTGKFKSPYK